MHSLAFLNNKKLGNEIVKKKKKKKKKNREIKKLR